MSTYNSAAISLTVEDDSTVLYTHDQFYSEVKALVGRVMNNIEVLPEPQASALKTIVKATIWAWKDDLPNKSATR